MTTDRPWRRRLLAALLALVLALPLASPVGGQFAVYDVANYVENALQAIRALHAIQQRVEQIRQLYSQLEWMAQQLEELEDPSYREVATLLYYVGVLVQEGEALAYSLDDFERRYRDLYRGYEVAEDLDEASREQMRVALDTFLGSMLSTQRLAHNAVPSQQTLGRMKEQLLLAEGAREVAQASGLITAHSAEESSKVMQQLALMTNMQAVYYAHALNREAMAEETFTRALERAYRPGLRYDASTAPGLVPTNYPDR